MNDSHCRIRLSRFIAVFLGAFVVLLSLHSMGCQNRIGNTQAEVGKAQAEVGNAQAGIGSQLSRYQEVPILDSDERRKILDDVAKLKTAWSDADDTRVHEICGTPRLGSNLQSTGFVARQALESTSSPTILLEYEIARVTIAASDNSVVYGNAIHYGDSWIFLNFASDPNFAMEGFGSKISHDSEKGMLLTDVISSAIKRHESGGNPVELVASEGVPFFAATERVTQPNVADLDKAIGRWNRKPTDIWVSKRVYVEVAVGKEVPYSDPLFKSGHVNQAVFLGFEEWKGKLCCTEGIRELRLILTPSETAGMKSKNPVMDDSTNRIVSALFSAGNLGNTLDSTSALSKEKQVAVLPFALKAYQQRQRVYNDESRIEIAKIFGLLGDEATEALPLLMKELTPNVLAESEEIFDGALDSILQIVGDTAVIQQLRKNRNVDAWKALLDTFDCQRILKETDLARLVEFLRSNDLQLIKSKLEEKAAEQNVRRRTRSQIEKALEFVKE